MEVGLKGSIIYDGKGGMGVHQVPLDYDQYELEGKGGRKSLTEKDWQHMAQNFVYFGGYKVDESRSIVEHHIETHINPGRSSTVAARFYTFSGDTMFLQPVDREPGLRIVWQRIYESPEYGLTDLVEFADAGTARALLGQEDAFTRSLSQFDINARLHKTDGTIEELMSFIQDQALEWTEEEKRLIRKVFSSIEQEILAREINISFPSKIYMIKTTSDEEGSAVAYTRSNFIVFQDGLELTDEWNVGRLLLHELFHILSRNDESFRTKMYEVIGFKTMPSVDYPQAISDLRITNPDAPQTDTYIRLSADGDSVDCMMILYSKEPYNGEGEFFDYLNIGFLALDGDQLKRPVMKDGQPVIYEMGEVQGFFEQIGNNTGYIIHPEEIMADNFSYAVTGKEGLLDPWIVERVLDILRRD